MTKRQEEPNSSKASSVLDKRQHDREISLSNNCTEGDVPSYQEVERVAWDEWVTHESVETHLPIVFHKDLVSRFPGNDVCGHDLHIEIKNAGLLDPAGKPRPLKRQHYEWSFRVSIALTMSKVWREPILLTVHRTAVSALLQIVSPMGCVSESQGFDVSCAFLRRKPREVEDLLFFVPLSSDMPGVEKAALIEIVKGVFGLPDFPVNECKEVRKHASRRLLDIVSNWTLPSCACIDSSGHLIGMIMVHVEDMLLATNNSHQAESHITRLLSKGDVKRAASVLRARAGQEGTQWTCSEVREMRSMTGSLHWVTGGSRPDQGYEQEEDFSTALIFQEQLFTSELVKVIQDVSSLILHHRTM